MGIKVQTLKGFRDYLPEDMRLRNVVINKVRSVFESFGFEELQTPALETQEVLLNKYGEDAERLMYLFEDRGKRKVGMRYDLTVPLARVSATNQNLPKPFKRYQIQPVWRADNTQKGRYREFYQCDIDTVGSKSPLADAEIVRIIDAVFKVLNFNDYSIRINSRSVLFSVMGMAGVTKDLWMTAIQSIDKLDKKSQDEVVEELLNKGLKKEIVKSIFKNLLSAKPDDYLNKTIALALKMGVSKNNLVFDPILSRGLDYYTGPIFESVVKEPKIGSLTGGGRYDNLLKSLGGPDLPAVGTTFGIERIIDVMKELQLLRSDSSTTQVLVTVYGTEFFSESVELAEKLRASSVNTELYSSFEDKLGKQIKYADKRGIPFVAIIGEEESRKNEFKLKNMKSGETSALKLSGLAEAIETIGGLR